MSGQNVTFDKCIQAMNFLAPADETFVRNCVSKYAKPSSCSQIIRWFIYRVIQAVKSLFGTSDWQIAEHKLKNNFLALASGIYQESPQNNTERKIKEYVLAWQSLASELLTLALHAKEGHSIPDEQITRRNSKENVASVQSLATAMRDLEQLRIVKPQTPLDAFLNRLLQQKNGQPVNS